MKLYGKESRFTSKHYNQETSKDIVRYGFVDEKSKWVIKPTYHLVKEFSEGLALVVLSEPERDKFTPMAYIDENNIQIIEINTPDAPEHLQGIVETGNFKNGFTVIGKEFIGKNNKKEEKFAIINKHGKYLTDFKFEKEEDAKISNANVLSKEIAMFGPDCLNWADENMLVDALEVEKLNIGLGVFIETNTLTTTNASVKTRKTNEITKVFDKIKSDKISEVRNKRIENSLHNLDGLRR